MVIQSEAPPVTIKNDTLEFNASSFKVRPDANVEALLKQLPGVEIDEEGKITVNGKEVNNILVNGKPFFGKDGKIATQNLPAQIISKVQVTDTKTKEESFTYKYLEQFPGEMKTLGEKVKPVFQEFWDQSLEMMDRLERMSIEQTEKTKIEDRSDELPPEDSDN